MNRIRFLVLVIILLAGNGSFAQKKDPGTMRVLGVDSVKARKVPVNDSTRKKHIPRVATIRSAIIPGWGQAYNRKYWKIPIVYGALGVTGSVFIYNIKQYRNLRFAFITLRDTVTADFPKVAAELQPFMNKGDANSLNSLRNYRDEYRKNVDYSVLFILLFWGLQVVDATVDAHLREFDISPDLSMRIKPSVNTQPNSMAMNMGLSVVFTLGKTKAEHNQVIKSVK